MKTRFLLFVATLLFSIQLTAQENLTLPQAVMGQYGVFYPQHVTGFIWTKKQKQYSYLKDYRTLMLGEVGGEEKEVLNIKEINKDLGTNFHYFSNMRWKNAQTFVLRNKSTIVIYNLEKASGTSIELPKDVENISIDPTCENVAFTRGNNLYYTPIDKFEMHAVTQNKDQNIVSGQAIAREEFGISKGIFWSPSGKNIMFYQKDETYVHDFPLLDINNYPGTLKSIKYPMAGQPSERPRVGIYSLKQDKSSFIDTQHGTENYLTNVCWTPDEQFVIVAEVARSQDHIWVHKYNTVGTLEKTLFEETSSTWVEPERPAYFPSNESNNFVWVSERDGFDNLYYYSIDGKLIQQITTNKFPLKEIVAAQNGEVYFTATGESPLNTLLYRVNTKGKQKLLTKEEGTHTTKVSSSGEFIFDQYSSHDVPNRAVIRDAKGKVKQEMVKAKNPLKSYGLAEAEIKTIQSRDGVDLYTRMIKPKDFDPTKKYPVLIYVYGGPHAQLITNSWLDGASLWMHWMANQGYIVYTLDNRGSANRGAEFEHVIHRKLGDIANQDQLDGVNYLKGLEYIDTNRIAVHGWSFGGFMTITMMMDDADIFKVGVAGGPVTDWKFYEVMYGERYMDKPEENRKGYAKSSLLNKAANLKGDLLMIYGSVDPVVVPQHSLTLIQKFITLGIQTDMFVYPMHEHNVRGKDRVHLMRKVLDYIIENNK